MPDVNKIKQIIDSRPLDSVLLTTKPRKMKGRSEHWDKQAVKAEAKWLAKTKEVTEVTGKELQLYNITEKYREKAKEAQSNYELRRDKWKVKNKKREEEDFNAVNLYHWKKQYSLCCTNSWSTF